MDDIIDQFTRIKKIFFKNHEYLDIFQYKCPDNQTVSGEPIYINRVYYFQ
jgi:predicted secreted protein